MSTGRPTLIDAAGPSRAPAAVLHPDDPLPKTWRVVSEWSYRGQSGAWLRRNSWHQDQDPSLCQVVFRTTAKRSPRTATTGQGLSTAARALVCSQAWELRGSDTHYWFDAPTGTRGQEIADKEARAAHLGLTYPEIRERDMAAYRAYKDSLQPKPASPPPSPPPAAAVPITDATYARLLAVARRGRLDWVLNELEKQGVRVLMTDAEWDALVARFRADLAKLSPPQSSKPQPDLIEEIDLPMRAYNALKRNDIDTVDELLGLSDSDLLRMRNMGVGTLRDIDAKLAEHGIKRTPRPQARKAVDGTMEPLSGPPAPGLDLERVRWLGERITYATGYGNLSDLPPHTRRRAAARRSLARVAGYEASRPEKDALYIGSGALVLAQLNEYARRVLDEGETPVTGGTDNALL